MKRECWVVALVVFAWLMPGGGQAQEAPGSEETVRLYFDCKGSGCFDLDFFRREIPVVDWVRDQADSDLHVLVTSQGTGGGGRLHTMAFIGRGRFAGQDQELTVGTSGDATDDEERRALADRLKLGLVRYLAGTPAADQIRISMGPPAGPGGEGGAAPGGPGGGGPGASQGTGAADDPWDFWVFRIGANGFTNGESSFSSSSYSGSLSANRTTDAWKFTVSGRFSRNESNFTLSDGSEVVSLIEDWSASGLLVKSLTSQWSLGLRTGSGRSTRRNEDFRWDISPGIEYNFFPYAESSRRSLTLQALVDVRHWDYEQITVYEQAAETRLAASLVASLGQVQPWGRANISLSGSQYLHDRDLYEVSVGGFVEFRLFRGFSVNVNGNYAWIRDQLFLPKGSLSTEEVLLRQRSLETSYNYFTSFGFSYRFGSIFNNVVNPRFGGSGGGQIFFF